jgi:hypothetical protein
MPLYPDDDLEDDAWDDGADSGDEVDYETVPCPYCRDPVHEQAEQCPHCGEYISDEDAPPTRRPWWVYVGVALCLLIVLLWIMSLW